MFPASASPVHGDRVHWLRRWILFAVSALIAADLAKWQRVMKDAGIVAE